MKTLVLVRHAKSDWDDPTLDDHQRPLNDRGRRDAPRMGERMHGRGVEPDLMLASSAERALSTAIIIAGELGYEAERIRALDRLYGATPTTMLEVLAELDDEPGASAQTVVLVAHDPGMSDLAAHFSAASAADAIAEMPTCAVAAFDFDVDRWAGLGDETPVSVLFDSPALAH